MTVVTSDGERVQGSVVGAGPRLHVEERIDAPGKLRVARDRLLCEGPCRLVVVAPLRFKEQAAKPEQRGLGTIEHGLEGAPRRRPVAPELRGLRPEQGGQRIARQVAPGDAGIALRLRAVADADGKQAARQRVISLLRAAAP